MSDCCRAVSAMLPPSCSPCRRCARADRLSGTPFPAAPAGPPLSRREQPSRAPGPTTLAPKPAKPAVTYQAKKQTDERGSRTGG
eukprot:1183304-Prorocentrum_minimum.AAC.1